MAHYHSGMIPEILELPLTDREKIIQHLHTAIADEESEISIPLQDFRNGESLTVAHFDYSELYNSFVRK